MKRKILVGLVLALLLCSTVGAFAATPAPFPWLASYNKPGQLNLYGSVGFYGFGIDANVGPEIIIGQFDIAGIPLEWGAMVRGLVGFSSYFGYASWIDWAVAPAATLHWGVDFGGALKFDWYIGLGLSISGSTGTYYSGSGSIDFGLASFDGASWQFSKNLALVVEYGYTSHISAGGIGVKLSL
jgi:hypothetical protein